MNIKRYPGIASLLDKSKLILGVIFVLCLIIVLLAGVLMSHEYKPVEYWHTAELTEEFTHRKAKKMAGFAGYLQLEDRLFVELDELIYAHSETGPEHAFDRYSSGSLADPRRFDINWNRTFEHRHENPRAGVVLLHGMSDSPYAMRSLGKALHEKGYWVIGMRLPGHGTVPSGLRHIKHKDMTAAVRMAMAYLESRLSGKPAHMIGYSNGAALAIEFTLDALADRASPVPDSLVLISPAIGVGSAAAAARFFDNLSIIPGLDGLSYTTVRPEFDPFKYNSFATNAADVVHKITGSVSRRILQRKNTKPDVVLPPVLMFKSTVDATVSTDAVIDNLLIHLHRDRHELVLFDINRHVAITSRMMVKDPAPFTNRVLNKGNLPFSVTLVANENEQTTEVVSRYYAPQSLEPSIVRKLDAAWPSGVISLSHVALPFPPDDRVYGQQPPDTGEFIFLGPMAIQGERGLLRIPSDLVTRLRYNPFYDYLESRTIDWLDNAGEVTRR